MTPISIEMPKAVKVVANALLASGDSLTIPQKVIETASHRDGFPVVSRERKHNYRASIHQHDSKIDDYVRCWAFVREQARTPPAHSVIACPTILSVRCRFASFEQARFDGRRAIYLFRSNSSVGPCLPQCYVFKSLATPTVGDGPDEQRKAIKRRRIASGNIQYALSFSVARLPSAPRDSVFYQSAGIISRIHAER